MLIHGPLSDYLKGKSVTDVLPTGCFDGACVVSTAAGALMQKWKAFSDKNAPVECATGAGFYKS